MRKFLRSIFFKPSSADIFKAICAGNKTGEDVFMHVVQENDLSEYWTSFTRVILYMSDLESRGLLVSDKAPSPTSMRMIKHYRIA